MNSLNLEQQVLALVAKITRHDVAELERDLFLESDLGLDSIKVLELANGLIQLIPEQQQAEFTRAVPLSRLIQLQTLGEAISLLENWSGAADSPSPATPASNPPQPAPETAPIATVELLDSQYLVVVSYWLTHSNSLFGSVRLRGDLDRQILWASWQALLQRHPMLRARFRLEGATRLKDYQIEILPHPTPPPIPFTDWRPLTAAEREAAMEEALEEFLNWDWQLSQWPLHQFHLYQLEDNLYQLVFANEHLTADGLSIHLVLREMLEIYRAKTCGESPQLPPATTVEDYQKLVKELNNSHEPEAAEILAEIIQKQGKGTYFWNPAENRLTSVRPHFANRAYRLSADVTAQLLAKTRHWRVSLNSLLTGAYLRTAARFESESPTMTLQIPTSGRLYPGLDASDFVGSFAQTLGLTFPYPDSTENWPDFLQRIEQAVQLGLGQGQDRIQTRQMAASLGESIVLKDGKIPEHLLPLFQNALKSNLYCPFTGHTHIQPQYQELAVVDYRAGSTNAAGTIDLLQEIFAGSLHFFANYDRNFFPEALIDRLMPDYLSQLRELAAWPLEEPSEALPNQGERLPTEQWQPLLQAAASEVSHETLAPEAFTLDLEADLGLDSLDKIRLVTRLERQLGKLDRLALLACRSLQEMALVLPAAAAPSPLAPQKAPQKAGEPPSSLLSPPPELAGDFPSPALPPIPYRQIAAQAKTTPAAIAVQAGSQSLTYAELDRQSNQIAHLLRQQGVGANTLVGVMVNRNPLLWVGILGILKAGGAYVPLDCSYPAERLRYMLEHAEIQLLLTEHGLSKQLADCLSPHLPLTSVLFLDEGEPLAGIDYLSQLTVRDWSQASPQDLPLNHSPDDLMVVLYTSGSTGQPKGVMLNHRGYMNRLQWMQDTFPLAPGERVAQKTSCCFDISVWEIFWPLMFGATSCPVSREIVSNPWHFARWLQEMEINIVHFVPSLFGEFLNALAAESPDFPALRWLIFSGEALPASFIEQWLDCYGFKIGLANLYGPTEASIDVSCYLIDRDHQIEAATSIPIGKAIDNVELVVLAENRQPVPEGELGELYIGGVQLAKGYLKAPEKTAASFLPNPLKQLASDRLYRTGDIVRQLPDGNYEYHGRCDSQVKIRGFRIELLEVEGALNSHPAVREAAVAVRDCGSGQKRLVGFLAGEAVEDRQLRQHLAQRLPAYMIPHRFQWLERLPKNHNGKLARQQLLAHLDSPAPAVPELASPVNPALPLGPGQRWLLRHFEAPYQWHGSTRFRYCQPLERQLFDRALNLLVERHAALRTRYFYSQGEWWQQPITPSDPLQADFYDGCHLQEAEREEWLDQLLQAACQTLRLDCWPLVKAIVVQVSEGEYEIIFVAHHLVADMLSSSLLFQDFWQAYTQLLLDADCQFQSPAPPSYSDYLQFLLQAEQADGFASHVDYWLSQFPSPASKFALPYDYLQGPNLAGSAAGERWVLGEESTLSVLERAKAHYGCSLYSLLLAPLYRLLREWGKASWVAVSHRLHGRQLAADTQFMESCGNFAVNVPVGLEIGSEEDWPALIGQIQDKFTDLPLNGVTFDWIGERLPSYLYPDSGVTPVRANYLGNRDLPQMELFKFNETDWEQRLSVPEVKRTALLEFFFAIRGGRLVVTIEYSRHFHKAATIRQQGDRYLELLNTMLEEISSTIGSTLATKVSSS